jgi:membrane protein DedA with SNARE-associated domain
VAALLDKIGMMPAIMVMLMISAAMFVDASPIIGLLLPGDLLFVTVVASSHLPQAVLTMAGVVVGTLCSWTLFFFVGSRLGPRLRVSRFGRWIGGHRWDSAEQLLAGRGARALTLVQFLPVFNAIMPMVAGVLGMRYRHFVRFAAPGTMLWAMCFGAIGLGAGLATDAAFGDSGSPFEVLLFGVPGLVAGWLMLVYVRRQLAAQRAGTGSAAVAGIAGIAEVAEVAMTGTAPAPADGTAQAPVEPIPLRRRPRPAAAGAAAQQAA